MPRTLSDLGDLATIIGLGISLVGFTFTLWSVSRSKKIVKRVAEAPESARNDIFRSNTIIELTAAMTTMEEIKRKRQSNSGLTRAAAGATGSGRPRLRG